MIKTKPRIQAKSLSHKLLPVLTGVLFIATLEGGCSSPAKGSKADRKEKESKETQQVLKIDEIKIKEFASHGYDSGIEYAPETSKLTLNLDSGFIQVTIVQPRRKGRYPLVIYMPGLGESSEAGKNIRNAWATSGYVVIAIQPLIDDELIMSTAAAKEGDFAYIRHERYANEVVSSRINVLGKLLEYLKQSGAASDTGLDSIDLEHIAIVGFDIGANSAMIVAGEEVQNVSNSGFPLKVGAVIALSPYADFSGATFNSRYQNIILPVLSITGDADDDTHGVVPITLHQAPFQYMPEGNKYLLLLAGATHSVIGNGAPTNDVVNPAGGDSKKADSESSNKGTGRSRGGRNGKKTSSNDSPTPATLAKRVPVGPTQRAMMEVAIEQISTAFLNAYIKSDQMAIEWLKKDTRTWLYNLGTLKQK